MKKVTTLHAGGIVSKDQQMTIEVLDESIRRAIDSCKNAKTPQGLIVALLHAHAHEQTRIMVFDSGGQ